MLWNEIIGHSREIEMLRNAAANGRLAAAYLFTGPEGVGRREVARALAKAVSCPEGKGRGDFCDVCSVCRRIDSGNFPEVTFYRPEEGTIKIEKIRELSKFLFYHPGEGTRRVIVIDGAEKLTPQAANSLLKILEEPPGGAIFILIAPGPEGLLPTIVSRCQRVLFSPLAGDAVAAFLVAKLGMTPPEAGAIAAASQGSMARALAITPESRREFRELALRVWQEHDPEAKWGEEFMSTDRAELLEELEFFRGLFRDLMVWKLAAGGETQAGGLINPDLEDLLTRERESSWEDIFRRLATLESTISLVRANANPRLAADQLLLGAG
ncbi:MAG: DNA polymerase III subunit delta' [bacterium]|nr:DNA polymerase III subunit delta' [bacterium]